MPNVKQFQKIYINCLTDVCATVHNPLMPNELLNANDAAAVLSVSRRTITRWARQKKLRSFRLGGVALRFRKLDLDEFISASEVAR